MIEAVELLIVEVEGVREGSCPCTLKNASLRVRCTSNTWSLKKADSRDSREESGGWFFWKVNADASRGKKSRLQNLKKELYNLIQ